MAYADTTWYVNGGDQSMTGYYSLGVWTAGSIIAAGALRRQNATPTAGQERVFVAILGGTTGATEPTWVTSPRGAKTADGPVMWMECTGQAALNGDQTNTPVWGTMSGIGGPSLGAIIYDSASASYQICTTAGATGGSMPTFSASPGATVTDGAAVWTSLGPRSNFSNGGAPFPRLASAAVVNWFASGNTIYVADNHTETQNGAITITLNSTPPALGKVLCHNHLGSYPPTTADLTKGASLSTTTGSNQITLQGTSLYVEGLTLQAGVGASSSTTNLTFGGNTLVLKNCALVLATTGNGIINLGSGSGAYNAFIDTTIKFNKASHYINTGIGVYVFQNVSLAPGSVLPTSLFNLANGNVTTVLTAEACDFSSMTSGFLASYSAAVTGTLVFRDCKLSAAVASNPVDQTAQVPNSLVQLVRCDSGNAGYLSSRYQYEGVESTEINIVRNGGAADPNGQQQSRKLVTNSYAAWLRPFKAEPYVLWNTKLGSVVVTLCGAMSGGILPKNDDLWMEVEYLTSGTQGKVITTTKANVLATGVNVAADNSTWANTSNWAIFKLVATLPDVGLAGYIYVRPRVGRGSRTFYLDPQVILS